MVGNIKGMKAEAREEGKKRKRGRKKGSRKKREEKKEKNRKKLREKKTKKKKRKEKCLMYCKSGKRRVGFNLPLSNNAKVLACSEKEFFFSCMGEVLKRRIFFLFFCRLPSPARAFLGFCLFFFPNSFFLRFFSFCRIYFFGGRGVNKG